MGVPSGRSRRGRRAVPSEVFGRNLRRACAARRIDAAMLAELTGRSRRSVERMLAGKSNPTLSLLQTLAQRIDVPLGELVRGL
jgi:transcriptional regulator with XRE-family HTH domain